MKTTALWIVAGIFGSIAVVLSQMNYLKVSITFGILSIPFLVLALFALRKDNNTDKRPRLIVRNLIRKPHSHPLASIEIGKPLRVQWDIVNIGDAPCEITDGNSTILVDTRPFDPRSPYGKSEEYLIGKKLKPGDIETVLTTSDTIDFNGPPATDTLRSGKKAIYFYGFVSYRDEIGHVRRTAYCRIYDPGTNLFTVVDNSDFEYAD